MAAIVSLQHGHPAMAQALVPSGLAGEALPGPLPDGRVDAAVRETPGFPVSCELVSWEEAVPASSCEEEPLACEEEPLASVPDGIPPAGVGPSLPTLKIDNSVRWRLSAFAASRPGSCVGSDMAFGLRRR
eukprot:CAMPEP_0181309748 /NCGR_PEP_ID=MMETSP1101-20121128/12186_1 /TAXON_ID=46948 /ORGANISM="Rhodomonas abbreviata, Strain Caron Lab Isolate" /LENGTH=129 /DNA_ID=CAMNT_0023416267 /DNA_START=136 /DNA_END=524 /DNA_ORIENTATION=-